MRLPLRMLGLVLAVLFAGTASHAATILGEAVLLSELIDGGPLTVGDKEFSDFSYSGVGDMPDADGVNVIPIQDDDGNYGIRLQGGFVDLVLGCSASDALVGFTVTALDKDSLISDAHLRGNPQLLAGGSISVTEQIRTEEGALAQLVIFDDGDDGAGLKLEDVVEFEPTRSVTVLKDILALAMGGSATLSFIDQTFSQVPSNGVPEPALGLLLGSAGLFVFGRRRGAR